LIPHLWSVLKGEPIRCDLAFGKPLAYLRGDNRKVIAGQAAAAIAGMLLSMTRAAEPDRAGQAETPVLGPLAVNIRNAVMSIPEPEHVLSCSNSLNLRDSLPIG
jgi:hypothetical protein